MAVDRGWGCQYAEILVREDKGIVLEAKRKLEGFSILQTKEVSTKAKCPSAKCFQRQRRLGMRKEHWVCRAVIRRDVSVDRDGSLTAASSFQEVMKEESIHSSFSKFRY